MRHIVPHLVVDGDVAQILEVLHGLDEILLGEHVAPVQRYDDREVLSPLSPKVGQVGHLPTKRAETHRGGVGGAKNDTFRPYQMPRTPVGAPSSKRGSSYKG